MHKISFIRFFLANMRDKEGAAARKAVRSNPVFISLAAGEYSFGKRCSEMV